MRKSNVALRLQPSLFEEAKRVAEAEGVAHSLDVSQVQPLEPAVATLAGSASVVVIVGADKAATVP